MKTADIKVLMENIAPVIKDFFGQSMAPITTRLDAIERRFSELPVPTNGKDADADAISNVVMLRLKPEVEGLAKIITQEIPVEIAKAVEKLPVPKDGSSVSIDDVAPIIIAEVAKRFETMPVPKDGDPGKSVTVEDVTPIIMAEVAKHVAAIPIPKDGNPGMDGTNVTVEEIAPLIVGEIAKRFETLPKAKDGVGVAGAIIDRDGNLVLTTTDGAQKDLGKVVGKDGADAEAIVVESAPDDVALTIAKAIRLMAETPEILAPEVEKGTINIHLPEMKSGETVFNVAVPEQKAPVVNVSVPGQEAPVVKVEAPIVNVAAPVVNYTTPKSRRVTQVKHDKAGRIIQTISEEQ